MDKKILFIIVLLFLIIASCVGCILIFLQNRDLKDSGQKLNTNLIALTSENDQLESKISDLNKELALFLSADEAAQKAVDFIKTNYGNTTASLVSVQPKSGVYEVKIKFGGAEYTSYVTKDGELFFTEGMNLKPVDKKEFTKTDKPIVDLFVMSFCPYGNQAEASMIPIVNLFKNKISLNLHYIFYSNYGTKDKASEYCYDAERKYCSMHGIQELNQGIRELCVAKYAPDKLWLFVKEINEKASSLDVDSKWEAIASGVGIDVQKIKTCYKNEADNLLASELALTEKNYQVQDPSQNSGLGDMKIEGSPTFVINGMVYNGPRGTEDIKTAICSAFRNVPIECQTILSSGASSVNSGACN